MYVPITTAALALLTVSILLLRLFWSRLPVKLQTFLKWSAVFLLALQVVFVASKWGTTSDHLNNALYWTAVGSYELLVVLLTRVPPRWLTCLCAFILLIPVFSASIVMPLTDLFDSSSSGLLPINNHLSYKISYWGEGEGNSGVDLTIFYRPSFAPFLRRKVQHAAFNNEECNANSAFVLPGPNARTVVARCPPWPTQHALTDDQLLVLR
jgi:hypothetical protein